MKPLYILKIGGSVATHKDKEGVSVRTDLLGKIARAIKKAQVKKKFDLILIHGAGAAGHQLASRYGLEGGSFGNDGKFNGSLLCDLEIQKLDNVIFGIFVACGLKVFPIHTSSVIVQKNKEISYFDTRMVEESLKRGCPPMLYGEMVFDQALDMSPCSGDAIASFLARKMKAERIFFASDIDGIFDKDPHRHDDAKLVENIGLKEILNSDKIKISGSHSVDVTGGLGGKIKSLGLKHGSCLKAVEIFNGLDGKNFENVLLGKKFPHTVISIK
ncbi:MAG: isopentenyl phosphate kinase [Candidatus Moranbacteria bacterium]|nr:isopentenyl phosphate kinase [Candidatus Moranbacteria bacterium]